MPAALTRIRTSFGPGAGTGTSLMRRPFPGAAFTIAFIAPLVVGSESTAGWAGTSDAPHACIPDSDHSKRGPVPLPSSDASLARRLDDRQKLATSASDAVSR